MFSHSYFRLLLLLKLTHKVYCSEEYDAVGSTVGFVEHRELRMVAPPVSTLRDAGSIISDCISQKLDHLDPQSGTYDQLYYYNMEFSPPDSVDGPVFLMLGGEGPASSIWLKYGSMYDYARNYSAKMFLLEHRFYGNSQPTSDWSTENLRQYLNSYQALQDASAFITAINRNFSFDNTTVKWIVFGGSYSGSLSAWMRLLFPGQVAGAISTSAPVQAEVNFKEFYEVVVDSLNVSQEDFSCTDAIKQAVSQIMDKLQSEDGANQISQTFNICPALNSTNNQDVAWFIESMAGIFAGVIQYNGQNPSKPQITDLCDIMKNESIGDYMTRYADVRNLKYGTYCLDFRYSRYIQDTQNITVDKTTGGRQWTFQTCNEFGYFQTQEGTDVFSPAGLITEQFWEQMCEDMFGPDYTPARINSQVNAINTKYLGKQIVQNSTVGNIVFITGTTDPWHALGVRDNGGNSDKYTVISVNGMSHCQDMLSGSENDSPGLKDARQVIADTIGKWITA